MPIAVATGMENELLFCEICDAPTPAALTHDGICGGCWHGHAADLAADGDTRGAAWALNGAQAARGQLQLADGR